MQCGDEIKKYKNRHIRNHQSFIYSPTDASVSCLKNIIKIYIKFYIKTSPTCFGAVTPSSGSALIHAY